MFLFGYVIWNGVDERNGRHHFSRGESVSQFQDRYYGSMSREINVNHETSQMRRALLNWRVESHVHEKKRKWWDVVLFDSVLKTLDLEGLTNGIQPAQPHPGAYISHKSRMELTTGGSHDL